MEVVLYSSLSILGENNPIHKTAEPPKTRGIVLSNLYYYTICL